MILSLLIMLGVVVLDQLTKILAMTYLQGQPSFPLWQDVLHFTYATNKGAAFGMLSDSRWIFMTASSIAIVGIFFYLIKYKPQNKWLVVSLAMVAGGGIGNMIDRLYLGYVVDFIDFTLIDFAIFNVADSFVCVGAGSLIAYLVCDIIRDYLAERQKRSEAEGENGHDAE